MKNKTMKPNRKIKKIKEGVYEIEEQKTVIRHINIKELINKKKAINTQIEMLKEELEAVKNEISEIKSIK